VTTGLGSIEIPVDANDGEMTSFMTNSFTAGETFLETLELELLQGSMYRYSQVLGGANLAIVNETLVQQMEWDQPIGKKLGEREIIGVVRDFHYMPLHEPIGPVFIRPYTDGYLDNFDADQQETTSIDLIISVTPEQRAETTQYIQEVIGGFSNQAVVDIVTYSEG